MLCKNGLHELSERGPCRECYLIRRHRIDSRRKVKHAANVAAHKRRVREVMAEAKNAGCTDCGARPDDLSELHFHHRDPTTKVDDVANLAYSLLRLLAEIAKCDVLCADCHYARHRSGQLAVAA